ncbi:lysosomal acid glucosylceramidase-like [Nylanderia fulva]|uniref:lysosomal acid glucosylceramidase-like n=1 Tax=Nylanderia fulva TaxID=613905 RepID=UPI0010FB04B1|nr:lysosomal acid glucosylceramidase-like [Nylanderia fulva]
MLRAIILIVTFVVVNGDKCAQRSCGDTGYVCVCNSTYCDTIEVPQKLQQDEFLWYFSTKDGKILEYSINKFSVENEAKNNCVLTLNSNKKYQQISGFGGGLTDSVALNIKSLSNDTQDKLLESYYGKTGIGYTYCRIPIAGTDFSTRAYTYDDVSDDVTLSNFSLVEEDAYKIHYLKCMKRIMRNPSDLRIMTAPWSPPTWMKDSNHIKFGCLKKEYYQTYADYIRKFYDAYKMHGIIMWGMSPHNEPTDGYMPMFPFNSMAWSPFQMAIWSVDYLAPTLSKAGYKDLVYIAVDDQRCYLPTYPDLMFKNKNAEKLFSGIAVHWYGDNFFSPLVLTETHDKYPDKFLLMTEACTGTFATNFLEPIVNLGSWYRGEQYMKNIIENLSHWVTGWIDWNIALDEKGGPTWVGNYVDSPIIVNSEKDEFYKQPMFYAISHFSKFVPRGSYVISSTEENCLSKKIHSIAFLTPEQKVIVVIANTNNESIPLTIKDENTNKIINMNLFPKSFNTISYLAY